MQSPFKRIVTFDLETGGFDCTINPITEMAMVAIDLETLEIIDTFSVAIKPRINLSVYKDKDAIKVVRAVFKNLAIKDEETKVSTLSFKGASITLKTLAEMEDDVEEFMNMISEKFPDYILNHTDILKLEADEKWAPLMELFFNNAYNPQALEVTHISRELFEGEGIEFEEAFNQVQAFLTKHTVGNSKPIMAGHNIGTLPRRIINGKEKKPDGFDNPFMEVFFEQNGADYFASINEYIIDTLKEARLIWYEAPGFNLGTCANSLDITLKEAHRALPDTEANAKVLIKMLKQYRGEGSKKSNYVRRKYNFNF